LRLQQDHLLAAQAARFWLVLGLIFSIDYATLEGDFWVFLIVPKLHPKDSTIHQRKGFLRVVPVRAGHANCQRHAPSIADQVTLTPAFGPIRGIRPGPVTPVHGADGTTVHDRPRSINLVVASEPIQERKVDQIPHARHLPIAQAPPARHPRSAPEFLREHLPGNAAAKDEDEVEGNCSQYN
jgi:hypothetical protein